eukprot:3876091-Rhodomonas_salina.1
MALALVFQPGNIFKDDAGKQDQKRKSTVMLWLCEKHPETFLLNQKHVHMHSLLKCLLDVSGSMAGELMEVAAAAAAAASSSS